MAELKRVLSIAAICTGTCAVSTAADAVPFEFSNGNVNNLMAVDSRPAGGGKSEIEAADDFVLSTRTLITNASFTGLLVPNLGIPASVSGLAVEIYRVFPNDSQPGLTSGP